MSDVRVRFVQQPTDASCVHACLSMVTGLDVHDLVGRLGNHGLNAAEEATVLTEQGLLPVPVVRYSSHLLPWWGVYFLTVPSLNQIGANHRVVVYDRDDKWAVVDPNRGRPGRDFYPSGALNTPRRPPLSYTEITYLQSLPLHHGTIERLRRLEEN